MEVQSIEISGNTTLVAVAGETTSLSSTPTDHKTPGLKMASCISKPSESHTVEETTPQLEWTQLDITQLSMESLKWEPNYLKDKVSGLLSGFWERISGTSAGQLVVKSTLWNKLEGIQITSTHHYTLHLSIPLKVTTDLKGIRMGSTHMLSTGNPITSSFISMVKSSILFTKVNLVVTGHSTKAINSSLFWILP